MQKAAREILPASVTTSFQGTAQAFQTSFQNLYILLLVAIMVKVPLAKELPPVRTTRGLRLERITLTEHLGDKGRPIPPDSRSVDHWFQHIAIVVNSSGAISALQ